MVTGPNVAGPGGSHAGTAEVHRPGRGGRGCIPAPDRQDRYVRTSAVRAGLTPDAAARDVERGSGRAAARRGRWPSPLVRVVRDRVRTADTCGKILSGIPINTDCVSMFVRPGRRAWGAGLDDIAAGGPPPP